MEHIFNFVGSEPYNELSNYTRHTVFLHPVACI